MTLGQAQDGSESVESTRLLIVGPPGAGKGTQAVLLSRAYGVPAISTGDIFRRNIAEGTPLGIQVKAIVDSGAYVPDSLTNELVKDRIAQPDAVSGFLLDGYPRTVDQVAYLEQILADNDHELDAVIQLRADTDEVVARLHKRAELEGRADDTVDVIRERMRVYDEQTAPLIDVFAAQGLLVAVDGLGAVDEVTARIIESLTAHGVHPA
jgi:adenylate kinase